MFPKLTAIALHLQVSTDLNDSVEKETEGLHRCSRFTFRLITH